MSAKKSDRSAVDTAAEHRPGDRPAEGIPGKPGVESPPVDEPTEPRPPLPLKPDQAAPEPVSPTGRRIDADPTYRSHLPVPGRPLSDHRSGHPSPRHRPLPQGAVTACPALGRSPLWVGPRLDVRAADQPRPSHRTLAAPAVNTP